MLSRTIEPLLSLLAQLHGRRVELEEVREYDLGRSFDLAPDELEAFMERSLDAYLACAAALVRDLSR